MTNPLVLVSVLIAASFAILLLLYLCYRKISQRNEHHYDSVNHELNDEEIEFKKILESQGDNFDDVFSTNDEDVDFDTSDRGRLDMLEKYRNNLIAGARASDSDTENFRL